MLFYFESPYKDYYYYYYSIPLKDKSKSERKNALHIFGSRRSPRNEDFGSPCVCLSDSRFYSFINCGTQEWLQWSTSTDKIELRRELKKEQILNSNEIFPTKNNLLKHWSLRSFLLTTDYLGVRRLLCSSVAASASVWTLVGWILSAFIHKPGLMTRFT